MALIPLTVGQPSGIAYRIAYEDWFRVNEPGGLEGWDCNYDTEGLPETLYPTREACQQAIEQL